MKIHLFSSVVALASLIIGSGSALAAPKSQVKERGEIHLSATLSATADAPAGATASAEVVIVKKKFKDAAVATLTLTTSGFPEGNYSVDGSLTNGSTPVHLGDFTVGPVATVNPAADAPITLTIPDTVDATLLVSLSISDSNSKV